MSSPASPPTQEPTMAVLLTSILTFYSVLVPFLIPSAVFQQFVLVPCYAYSPPNMTIFVFGDSLVDTGNNNYIETLARANFPPYGIDLLPDHLPTGRFTNGRTVPDILGQQLHLDFDNLPYMAPNTTGRALFRGINYASGAGGILSDTGELFGERFSFDMQLDNFANTRQKLISMLGPDRAQKLLRNSLFFVIMGSNDILNNYLLPVVSDSMRKRLPPHKFVETLITKFHFQLKRLYDMDARKIVVNNIGPIGCIPNQIDVDPSPPSRNGCVKFPNELAMLFNMNLSQLVTKLSSDLEGSQFVYANLFHIVSKIIRNYKSYGFEEVSSACCGGLLPCGPPSLICSNRSNYIFWDPYHPTEATYQIVVRSLLDGGSKDISPVNIRKLAGLVDRNP